MQFADTDRTTGLDYKSLKKSYFSEHSMIKVFRTLSHIYSNSTLKYVVGKHIPCPSVACVQYILCSSVSSLFNSISQC